MELGLYILNEEDMVELHLHSLIRIHSVVVSSMITEITLPFLPHIYTRERSVYKVLVGNLEGKRPIGRPKNQCEYKTKLSGAVTDLCVP